MENTFTKIPLNVLLKYNDVINNIRELQLHISFGFALEYLLLFIFGALIVAVIHTILKTLNTQKLIPNNIKKLINIITPEIKVITTTIIITITTIILFFVVLDKTDYNLNNIPNQIHKNIISDTPTHLEKELEKQKKIKAHIENKYPELKNAKKIIITQKGSYYYYDIKYDTKEIIINIE